MPFYESICILRSSLVDEEATAIFEKIKAVLEVNKATISKAENWGKKKLAYEIQHDRRGIYLFFQFEAAGMTVSQLERTYRLEDSVLKFLTIRVEEEELLEIAGEKSESSGGGF